MIRKFSRVQNSTTPMELGLNYADLLIDFVHLDELTGQAKRNIFNSADLALALKDPEPEQVMIEQIYPTAKIIYGEELSPEDIKLAKELSQKLGELYDEYNELFAQGKTDQDLVERIFETEDKLRCIVEPSGIIPQQKEQ